MLGEGLDFIVEGTAQYAGKSLIERATGRFYTPDTIGLRLASGIVKYLEEHHRPEQSSLSLCDPFAGDGRLLTTLISQIARSPALRGKTLEVHAYDIDKAALKTATRNISAAAAESGITARLTCSCRDSFAVTKENLFDVVVTNPPWEVLKPDPREIAGLTRSEVESYRAWLRLRCDKLDRAFPEAKADHAWAGWGTNLARCGWQLAMKLSKPRGAYGIVLPTTLFADQTSHSMRKHAFGRAQLLEISSYPAEARMFDRVDQAVTAAVFALQPNREMNACCYLFDHKGNLAATTNLRASQTSMAERHFTLPLGFGGRSPEILDLFEGLPSFQDLEGTDAKSIWAGRELDETRIVEKLSPTTKFPFLKGRMVRRHGLVEHPAQGVSSEVANRYASVKFERLVWRDVARSTQKRRMIGMIIPAGWVAGNSLHVAHMRDGNPIRLRSLHAVLTSLVFEFQVRTRLATSHMSLGIVRGAKVPILNDTAAEHLATLVENTFRNSTSEPQIEISVAKAFGLCREKFEAVVSEFPKITGAEREQLLQKELWD